MFATLLSLALATGAPPTTEKARPPHIVFFLADDLGWTDVGWHGSEIRTPHLDALATAGVKLEQFHVLPVCSPTRCALMTGRYPMRCGLQTGVVRPWARYGLPLEERTLPQALKEVGYTTALVGKWHLGHFEKAYLPTRRGFDHQYGHYNGMIDYWTHERDGGFDWHRDDRVNRDEGYTTQLLAAEAVRLINKHDPKKPLFLYVPFNAPHSPLQAPADYLKKYDAIKNQKRRSYAAMVSCLDDAVGSVMTALKERGMTGDTLVLFSSDNGGPVQLGATNGALRASKGTLYQGGVQVPAFATWPGQLKAGTVCREPLHMVDWYPTLLRLAGAKLEQKLPVDGKDIWPTLSAGRPSPHDSILINVEKERGALREGNWKLVARGDLPFDAKQNFTGELELFDLGQDPGEKTNRADKEGAKARALLLKLNGYAQEAVKAQGGGGKPANFKTPKVWGEHER